MNVNATIPPILECHPAFGAAFLFSYLGTISLVFGGFSAVIHIVYYVLKGWPPTLVITLEKLAAGFAIPGGCALLLAAFDIRDLLACVENLGLYVFVGSVSVVWIAFLVLFPGGFTGWPWIQRLGKRLGLSDSAPPGRH